MAAAPVATIPNPKIAATIAITRKIRAQYSIGNLSIRSYRSKCRANLYNTVRRTEIYSGK
jgi:hypothetical protein